MRLAVTGDRYFLDRYRPLTDALTAHATIDILPTGNLAEWLPLRIYNRLTRGTPWHDRLMPEEPSAFNFSVRSKTVASAVAALPQRPDALLHLFCTSAPPAGSAAVPYAMYLDYTMEQAARDYPPWAAFRSARARQKWLALEKQAYARARHLLVMTPSIGQSLREDYQIDADRVTVVWNAGSNQTSFTGDKTFGSRRLFFDGSDWQRKGGGIVVSAFAILRRYILDATLVVVGRTMEDVPEGVINLGAISDRGAMEREFRAADLVLAPALCDPCPGFVIEGLQYGVPCVLSVENGLAPLIAATGAGVVVSRRDPQAYADAMLTLLRDHATLDAMSRRAREAARTRLSAERVAAAIGSVLLRIGGEG
jgi:glycosyltransferase involved in cell wall biosynthesis